MAMRFGLANWYAIFILNDFYLITFCDQLSYIGSLQYQLCGAFLEETMPYQLLVHLNNEDPLIIETEELPKTTDLLIIGRHPRRRDNKEVHYIQGDVTTVIFPLNRISFIEVLPSAEEEEIFRPFRD
jgi:hypothetical protein